MALARDGKSRQLGSVSDWRVDALAGGKLYSTGSVLLWLHTQEPLLLARAQSPFHTHTFLRFLLLSRQLLTSFTHTYKHPRLHIIYYIMEGEYIESAAGETPIKQVWRQLDAKIRCSSASAATSTLVQLVALAAQRIQIACAFSLPFPRLNGETGWTRIARTSQPSSLHPQKCAYSQPRYSG